MKPGDKLTKTRVITEEDIINYGKVSNDHNPIHFDNEFAAKTVYRKRIAHGLIGASMISSGVTELLGDGSIILELNIKMKSPVFINDKLSLNLGIKEISGQRTILLNVLIRNQNNSAVIEGTTTCIKVY